ncbi:energy transducer TonB [Burkholderia stagnalis]|uniref:energy transducer TonB n=1 Tax=Burkholderia stagnalis TaxID=1503054 RepID=UPI000AFC5B66|nr:energy transducer TonB [Burkholderia stagnalis]
MDSSLVLTLENASGSAAAGRLTRVGRGRPVALCAAVALHALLLVAIWKTDMQLDLHPGGAPPAGSSISVTLVSNPVPPSVPMRPPAKPVARKSPVTHHAPVLATHRQAPRSAPDVSPDTHEPDPQVQPPQPTQPADTGGKVAASAQPSAPQPMTLGNGQDAKSVAHVSCDIEKPPYPARARRLNHEGKVVLRVTIDVNGRITEATTAESSGFDELDAAARAAMLAGHCMPYLQNGTPIVVRALQPLDFRLDN